MISGLGFENEQNRRITVERCLACEADGRGNLDSREKARKAQKEDKLNRGWTQISADGGRDRVLAIRWLAVQHIGPRSIDDIASAYFPPGTSVRDAITMLKATAHASVEGPRLFQATRPDGKTTEWFGVRACISYGSLAGGPQVWFDLEIDQPNPTKIRHAKRSIMSVYL